MVGGLVHLQTAGVGLETVPAPKVICAMGGVQQPMEIHRDHITDHTRHEQLLELGARRRIAVIKGDLAAATAGLACIQDTLAFVVVDGHRFLGDHVAAQLHCPAGVLVVGAVLAGDDDNVGPGLGDHALELGVGVGFDLNPALARPVGTQAQATGVIVTDRRQLAAVRELLDDRLRIEQRAPADTYLYVSLFCCHMLCNIVSKIFTPRSQRSLRQIKISGASAVSARSAVNPQRILTDPLLSRL